MTDLPDLLFSDIDLAQSLRVNLEQARNEIDQIPEDQFLCSSDEEIRQHIQTKLEVLPITVNEDGMEMEQHEVRIDVRHDPLRAVFDKGKPCLVSGVRVTVTIPFEGHVGLWKCRPSRWDSNPPRATVRNDRGDLSGRVEIVWEGPSDTLDDGRKAKARIDELLSSIRTYLGWIRGDAEVHNRQLAESIREYCANRRQRLGKHSTLAKTLNIPLRRNPNAPDLTPLPIKRKLVRPLPVPSNRPPEPGITDEQFGHILSVIRHEGASFEATPRTFAVHDEEELRDIILAHLNGHYQGGATGEAFRKSGKTDIKIEVGNRSAFVAECKVWRGEAEAANAVDQMLNYLTWRDSKAGLVFFNKRNANFASLQAKLPQVIRGHRLFVAEVAGQPAVEWRFQMRSIEDSDRKVTVHVFLFNLYVP